MSPLSRSFFVSVPLGIGYGVALRVLMATNIEFMSGIVSISFFVFVPVVIGALTVYFGNPKPGRSFGYALVVPWISIAAFLLTTMLLMLEGSICVLMALPGFLGFSSIGGWIGFLLLRAKKPQTSALCAICLLPLVLSPFEASIPANTSVVTIVDQIEIDASPDAIWNQITNVDEIREDELRFGITRLLGVPRPLSAHMAPNGNGWVRNTRWADGIAFREIITHSRTNEVLEWEFDFPPTAIPEGVLDEHVRIGGQHLSLIEGHYVLTARPDGGTTLEISTTLDLSARPQLYARYWAKIVMTDFHKMILELLRDRSEAENG